MTAPPEPQTVSDEVAGPPPGSLRRSTTRGFVWTMSQAIVVRGLSLVGFVVLARLLSPHDYGLAAIANVFVVLLQMISAGGFSQTLVQRPEVDETDLDTIFWISLGTSVALAVGLCVAAWPLAALYHEPELRPVLQVLSVTFVAVALGATHAAVIQRRLEFRLIAWPTMLANLIATAVGVGFAVLGFGVWSLVVQTVLGPSLGLVFIVPRSGYRPGRNVSRERFRELFASSRHFLGGTLMNFLNGRADDFLIGATLGPVLLGVYAVAYRVLTVMIDVLSTTSRSVAFPIFSRVQHDRARLGRAYTSVTRMCAVIAMPGYLLAFAAAPEIVDVLFGHKWHAAIPVMRILALFGPVQAVGQFNGALLQSIGRARLVFRLLVAGTVLQVIAFAIAVPFGIQWVAASLVIRAYVLAPIGLRIAAHAIGGDLRSHLSALVAPAVSSVGMAAAVMGIGRLLSGGSETLRLLVELAVALPIYAALLRLIGPVAFREAVSAVTSLFERRRSLAGVAQA